MCECYQIGGRFIAEDPDCPVHGRNKIVTDDSRIEELEQQVARHEIVLQQMLYHIQTLAALVAQGDNP